MGGCGSRWGMRRWDWRGGEGVERRGGGHRPCDFFLM